MSSALDREGSPLAGCLTAVSIRVDPRSSVPPAPPSEPSPEPPPGPPPEPPPGSSGEVWRAELETLPDDPVEVWRAELDTVPGDLMELLSPAERTRAARIAREEDRKRWMRARGLLRALLGSHLQRDPRALRFQIGKHGKPALAGSELNFNLSHSAGLALYALARGAPVGVDVEVLHRRPQREEVALAERVFGAQTASRLRALAPPARRREFLREWVRHEAILKCLGVGLTGPQPSQAATAGLWIAELDVGPRAAAAVAVGPQAL